MTPRSIRRAAERKAEKEARRAARLGGPLDNLEQVPPAPSVSEARLAANAANARQSTGPRTPEGKSKLSVNAVTTALTGRTVLLPVDDVAVYRQHVQDFADQLQPVGPLESELVQALADHAWRLNRIASLEMAIFAAGHEQFAEQFADRADMQGSFTQMHTFLHYEKQIRNLQIQEMRLRRNREKDTAELLRLQHERVANLRALQGNKPTARPAREPESSAPSRIAAETARNKPERASNLCDNGFVFSSSCENSEMDAANQLETAPVIGSQGLESDSRPQIAA